MLLSSLSDLFIDKCLQIMEEIVNPLSKIKKSPIVRIFLIIRTLLYATSRSSDILSTFRYKTAFSS